MEQNKKKLYGICLGGLVALVLGAFLAPQFVFAGQDRYRMEHTWQENRNSLDIEKLSYNYEKSVVNRMHDFARGISEKKTYYTSFIDYEINQEILDIAAAAMEQEWMNILWESEVVPFSVGQSSETVQEHGASFKEYSLINVTECKKYVICEDNFENGAAIIAWYIKINVNEVIDLKLLIDVESGNIYYMQACNRRGERFKTYAVLPDYMNYYFPGWKGYEYYGTYYEAEDMEKVQFLKEENPQEQTAGLRLFYGSYPLDFEIKAEGDLKINIKITAGIRQLGEMIPEMMQE